MVAFNPISWLRQGDLFAQSAPAWERDGAISTPLVLRRAS